MKIDSHQHFWRYEARLHAWITEEVFILRGSFLASYLLPKLQANGVEGCIAVQAAQTEEETMFLLGLADQYSQIKGVVGWADISAPDFVERLEYFTRFKSCAASATSCSPNLTIASFCLKIFAEVSETCKASISRMTYSSTRSNWNLPSNSLRNFPASASCLVIWPNLRFEQEKFNHGPKT